MAEINIDKTSIDKILGVLFPTKDKSEDEVLKTILAKKRFILDVILTFRLKIETINKLFGLSFEELITMYNEVNPENQIDYDKTNGTVKFYCNPISYCLNYDDTLKGTKNPLLFDGEKFISSKPDNNQDVSLGSVTSSTDWSESNVIAYFEKLYKLLLKRKSFIMLCNNQKVEPGNRYVDEIKKLYLFVGDSFVDKAIEFMKNKNPNARIPDEIKEALIRYQHKYALSTREIALIIGYEHAVYAAAMGIYIENNKSWYARAYKSISGYNSGVRYAYKRK